VATNSVDGFTTPSGQVRPKSQDRETFVLAKGPEGWKLVHSHNTVIDAEAAKHDPVNAPPK
jgi:ketosteroid isomerase-like protein